VCNLSAFSESNCLYGISSNFISYSLAFRHIGECCMQHSLAFRHFSECCIQPLLRSRTKDISGYTFRTYTFRVITLRDFFILRTTDTYKLNKVKYLRTAKFGREVKKKFYQESDNEYLTDNNITKE